MKQALIGLLAFVFAYEWVEDMWIVYEAFFRREATSFDNFVRITVNSLSVELNFSQIIPLDAKGLLRIIFARLYVEWLTET